MKRYRRLYKSTHIENEYNAEKKDNFKNKQ